MHRLALLLGSLAAGLAQADTSAQTVLVTGATGKTGVLLYQSLRSQGVQVRALVRDVAKARKVLGCSACDPSEGIFVGDVTRKETLQPAMAGVTGLAIVTAAVPHCTDPGNFSSCTYPEGATPLDVDFNGGKAQIAAFGEATKGKGGPVVLCSSMGTTQPNNFLDKLGNGHILFYKLNLEADLASSGLQYTVVKPCGLVDGHGPAQLIVGHDDDIKESTSVSRADVARVMAEAFLQPELAAGLRFDLCARQGPATKDLGKLFKAARWPWQQEQSAPTEVAV